MRRLPYIVLTVLAVALISACRRTPSHVLCKEDMAQLLADLYMGESVVDMQSMDFRTDSTKLLLRQSIMALHGVTLEQFDTSLGWYGRNIDLYLEVYERTIKILDDRSAQIGNAMLLAARSISGDSVDVWGASRYARFNKRMPADRVMFDIEADENWEPGDIYTWRMKIIGEGPRTVRWCLYANYADSTCEWINMSTSMPEWNEMTFVSDSTKSLTLLTGSFEVVSDSRIGSGNGTDNKDVELWIDSISLIRKRTHPDVEVDRLRTRIHSSKVL